MSNIPFALSNVSDVAVQPVDASATISTGGLGGVSIFSGVVVSDKGAPFEVLSIKEKNWKKILGYPFHPTRGALSESLRHVGDAIKAGDGRVVRVVPSTATFSVMTGADAVNDASNVIAKTALAYGTPVGVTAGKQFAFYVKDGDPRVTRSLAMTPIADKPGFFDLILTDVDSTGSTYTVQDWEVSFDPHATDDMGQTAFVGDVLESTSPQLGCVLADNLDATLVTGFAAVAMDNATNGNLADIGEADYAKAIAVLKQSEKGFTAVLGLGVYNSIAIAALGEVANARRVGMFADVEPSLSYALALDRITGLALNNHRCSMYHFPYSAKDPYFGGRAVWGLSGVAFQAKAKGVRKVSGSTGGWHYAAAGVERGVISRREVKQIEGIGEPDFDAMYLKRINKIGFTTSGAMVIDDSLTTWVRKDYLRFEWVGATSDAISRRFYAMAMMMKHEPDGITLRNLSNGIRDILDDFVASGALVKPRNPEEDGVEEYIFEVVPVEIDLWEVKWWYCVTGSARRILGTPTLIR